jgi:hypothetical protein
MFKRLPHGPNRYWVATYIRIGTTILASTRLIGRWYWVTPTKL